MQSVLHEQALPSALTRWVRLGPWNRNPLMRAGDRVWASVVLIAVVIALLAVPLALTAGTVVYTDAAARIQANDASKTVVAATIIDDPAVGAGHRQAQVSWPDGEQTRSGLAPVPNFVGRGARIHVWLTPDGRPTDPPAPPDAAVLQGIGTGVGLASGIWVMLGIGVAYVWHARERRRAQWLGARSPGLSSMP
ncbi:hypothetical protein ACIP5Y_47480 [Nocardia sp. NPDC088792]|uniref:Rv1733c family protein n=1 Tax=Nocardia sp. NPDC088792 TaxID=3364332 RepID=UPI00382BF8B8